MENMPTWLTIILALGGLLGGALGTWLITLYQARNKQRLDESEQKNKQDLAKDKQVTETRMAENEQAFKIYKELVDNLRDDVHKMRDDMEKLEKEHLTCREENATLKAELKSQSREIDSLKGQMAKTVIITPIQPSASIIEEKK